MSEVTDFLGRPLRIGDLVAFMLPNYRELTKGNIIAFTPQQVRIQYDKRHVKEATFLTYPQNVIRIYKDLTLKPDLYTPSERALLGRRVEIIMDCSFPNGTGMDKVEKGEKAEIFDFTSTRSYPIVRLERNHAVTFFGKFGTEFKLLDS